MNSTRLILSLILFFQFALGILYATRTPLWQAPDEPAHYNYVRELAETGAFPVLQQGDYDPAYLEEIKARKFPPELAIDSLRYEAHQPPLYYVLAAPVYLTARALQLDAALLLRYFNVALALVLSCIAYLIFARVFLTSALLRLAGVGIIATLPMHIAMSAAINNDTLAEIVVAVMLLFSILRAQGKLDDRRFMLFGGLAYAVVCYFTFAFVRLVRAQRVHVRRKRFARVGSARRSGGGTTDNRAVDRPIRTARRGV
ncbi:MAG: hypothetical protein HY741_03730 [Chloroflexi bacterium]|nr:hypothetical protein [Chloroflexota bacterium]